MTLDNFLAGLAILRPHYTGEGGGHPLQAEHDELFLQATDTPLTEPEVAKLRELGWRQPHVHDPTYPDLYDSEESWRIFT